MKPTAPSCRNTSPSLTPARQHDRTEAVPCDELRLRENAQAKAHQEVLLKREPMSRRSLVLQAQIPRENVSLQ